MAIQQMGLMHYRAPPATGDSAYLETGILDGGSASIEPIYITFNPTGVGLGYVQYSFDNTPSNYVWKTGPNSYSSYYAKLTYVSGDEQIDPGSSALDTWHELSISDSPTWTYLSLLALKTGTYNLYISDASFIILNEVQIILSTNAAG